MASPDPDTTSLRIMAVVEWYPPAYKAGGPIRSVANLVALLRGHTNHKLSVVCGAYDIGSDEVLADVAPNTSSVRDGVEVTYLTRDRWTTATWRRRLAGSPTEPRPDVIYLNSLFSVPFALTPLRVAQSLGIRVVLAPRGMLGEGALAIKPFKKKVFLTAARALGAFRDVRWHASTAVEAADIVRAFPKADVAVASNAPLSALSTPLPMVKQAAEPLHFALLGRVHRIKNQHFGLQALAESELVQWGVVVEIVGPAEDKRYLDELMALAKPGLEVRFAGPVPPHRLHEVWSRSHALLMPTTHENFGHAVVEAWAHGRPVLLSDKTPWRGLAKQGLGWDVPLEHDLWVRQFNALAAWDESAWQTMSQACVAKHKAIAEDAALVQANRDLFERG